MRFIVDYRTKKETDDISNTDRREGERKHEGVKSVWPSMHGGGFDL